VGSGSTGSAGTYAQDQDKAFFHIIGSLCYTRAVFRITNKGSWATDFHSSLPITAATTVNGNMSIWGWICAQGSNPATAGKGVSLLVNNQAYLAWHDAFGSAPLTWTDIAINDWVQYQGFYRI